MKCYKKFSLHSDDGDARALWPPARISPHHSRQDKTLWSLNNSPAGCTKKERKKKACQAEAAHMAADYSRFFFVFFFTRRTNICSTGVATLSLSCPLRRVSFSLSSAPPGLFLTPTLSSAHAASCHHEWKGGRDSQIVASHTKAREVEVTPCALTCPRQELDVRC